MDELERQFKAAMNVVDPPLAANSPLRKAWIAVARRSATKLNARLKQELVQRPKRPSTNAGMPELVKWFMSLTKPAQTTIVGNWTPAKAHFIQKSRSINLDLRDDTHIDENDYFGEIVTESVAESMNENTDWVGPLLTDYLKSGRKR